MNSKIKLQEKLVSIGIPTYSRPDFLERAIAVARAQTYSNLEIIISDNGSNDPRVHDLLLGAIGLDSRIKVFFQKENCGLLKNTEFVLKQARGEYFMWLSDDDWRAPEFVEVMVDLLDKNPMANFSFCDYTEVDQSGNYIPLYPRSHRGIFKPLQNKNRIKRFVSYALTDRSLGMGNSFYALFRTKKLIQLNFEKLSDGYTKLNLDHLIVFKILLDSPLLYSSDQMCTLTCGNSKHYSLAKAGSNQTGKISWFESRTIRYFEKFKDPILTIIDLFRVSERFVDRLLLVGLGLVKVGSIFIKSLYRSLFQICELNRADLSKNYSTSPSGVDKIQLPQVTLIAVATKSVEETLEALKCSCSGIDFGAVKLLSHYAPFQVDLMNVEHEKIQKMRSIDDWSKFIVYELANYVETEFALLIHADGFVVNPTSWRDEFLKYDYTGAPWPLPTDEFSYRDESGNVVRVGNSVSLRSLRLLKIPNEKNLPWEPFHGFYNEDGFICVKNRKTIEGAGMSFAPIEVAKYFSHEAMIPEVEGIKPFVFHKWAGSNSSYPNFMKEFEVHHDCY